jgi:hypothetical protein
MQDPILIQSFLPPTLKHNPLEFQNNSLVRYVERQIIRLLIVITTWIFLIKAGIPPRQLAAMIAHTQEE